MREDSILEKSWKRAINGGASGFAAMTGQVFSMMWIRTAVNYQYRNGGNFTGTVGKLMREGGIPRFYRGLPFALMQAPISRFGDTASNIFFQTYLEESDLSGAGKTFIGSTGAALWRMAIMPLDTCKTTLQVNGKNGVSILRTKISLHGPGVMYHGALASGGATLVGHFPWFYTYNTLQELIPRRDNRVESLCRSAAIGFTSTTVSDFFSNTLRVVKTNRQTSSEKVGYLQVSKGILEKEGWRGLVFRGLGTKIISNGIQGMVFTVIFDLLLRE